ncbi:pheromone-processing carboxypeptidase KEX1 [Cornus florida]|uniref:pheromone-processing carboxypeptidase KEX1 n=1 Tax=Cornus florida TaxID=4283 RepID=UPI00289EC25E|nr:pheromone-processing carboxypeptidase KEX1 [Cornus florida]
MEWRNFVDMSSFLLFEAAGDSEADSDLNMDAVDTNVADDDAQSCSCDFSDSVLVPEFDDFSDDQGSLHHDDDDDDGDEEEEEAIDQNWTGDSKVVPPFTMPGMAVAGQLNKMRACVDSNTEMQKNRDFWETCLAS